VWGILLLALSLLSNAAKAAQCHGDYCEDKAEREQLVGTWQLVSVDEMDNNRITLELGAQLYIRDCGEKLCALPVIDGKCGKNAIMPYNRMLNEQRDRLYVMRMKGLPEPYYVGFVLMDPDDRERPRRMRLRGASFSFYKKWNSLALSEAGLAFETTWHHVGNVPCKR